MSPVLLGLAWASAVDLEVGRAAVLELRASDALDALEADRRGDWVALHTWLRACVIGGIAPLCEAELAGSSGEAAAVLAWHRAREGEGELALPADAGAVGPVAEVWSRVGRDRAPDGSPTEDLHPLGWAAHVRWAARQEPSTAATLARRAREAHPGHPEVLAELFSAPDVPALRPARRFAAREVRRARPGDDAERLRWIRLAVAAGASEPVARWVAELGPGVPAPATRAPYNPKMERAMAAALAATRDPRVSAPTAADSLAVGAALGRRLIAAGRAEEAERMWADLRSRADATSAAVDHASVLLDLGRADEALVASQDALDLAAGGAPDDLARLDAGRWASELAGALGVHARALEATGREGAIAAALAARLLPAERTAAVVAEVGASPGALEGPAGRAASLLLEPSPGQWRDHARWLEVVGQRRFAEVARAHAERLEGRDDAVTRALAAAWDADRPAPDSRPSVEVGRPFPLELLGLEVGQRTLVVAWASWCGPCRTELPVLDALLADYPEARAVALSVDQTEPLYRRAVDRYGFQRLAPRRDPGAGARLEVGALPTLWLVDEGGLLIGHRVGYAEDALDDVRAFLEER